MPNIFINAFTGLIVGIVINYLADVLPYTRRLSSPLCNSCNHKYTLKEYLFSRVCESCRARRSIRGILVVMVSIVICVLLEYFPLRGLTFWPTIPILLFLGIVFVIDVEHRAVLIQTSIAGFILFFIYGVYLSGWLNTIIGGAAGFLIMLGLYYLGILFNRVMGKIRNQEIEEVALGFGDVYVSGFLGFFTGWPTIIGTIIMAIIGSGVFSLLFILVLIFGRRYKAFSAIPYAPFLILGALATFYI